MNIISIRKCIADTDVGNDVRVPGNVFLHELSYDIYDIAFSTE